MEKAIVNSSFQFKGQKSVYNGKVRDVYTLDNGLLVMVASDRISAFDHILSKGIPFKGQVLNQVATMFLEATRDIVPNWLIATPDPSVAVGHACEPIRIEMVIRGYMSGHAAREYKAGKRVLCGVPMPEGMKENDKFPEPIITPATKADEGHDEDHEEMETSFFDKSFSNSSLAFNFSKSLNDFIDLDIGFASVERAPSAVELFMNGSHLATGRFEVGNANLISEKSNNIDFTLNFNYDNFFFDHYQTMCYN